MHSRKALLVIMACAVGLASLTACSVRDLDVVHVGVRGEWYYSNIPLKEGQHYIIRVEGTFNFDEPAGKLADAEFVKDGDSWKYRGERYQPIGIMINGIGYPGLEPFSWDLPNHVYQ